MKVAVLQINFQGISSTKFYKYIRSAHAQNVRVLVLGEYTTSPFFKELEGMSKNMINEQTTHQVKVFKELASSYNMTIIAPIIMMKKQKLYKTIAKFSPASNSYYDQQILINYKHWNEEKFFANEITELKSPLVFNQDGFKFAVISGYELHFDEIFAKLKAKNIDCVIVPSVSTFDSFERWKNLITSRSFTHNCYILRANRVGEYQEDENITWKFYGDSLLSSPNGEILEHLGNKEELMIVSLCHTEVVQARKLWGFREAINKREN